MNENMVSENQQIYDSGYLEQKNQGHCQDLCAKMFAELG